MTTTEQLKIAREAILLNSVWYGMHKRCNNPSDRSYPRYGGRGIQIEWLSFEDFFIDMYPTYEVGLSLDRIDNDGNYSNSNCRWATSKEQANNKSDSHYITYKGKKMTIAQWAEELGLRVGTINQRITQYGWDEVKALTTPIAARKKGHCVKGHPFSESTKRADGKGYWCRPCYKLKYQGVTL